VRDSRETFFGSHDTMREHMEKVVPNPSLVPAQQLAAFLKG
jgi:hypothetical protein